MNIPWRLKSSIFSVIDFTHAEKLLYMVQKNLTGRSLKMAKSVSNNWLFHEEQLKAFDKPSVIEFGAGKSLAQNVYLSRICSKQILVDLNPMLDLDLVNESAKVVSEYANIAYRPVNTLEGLAQYGIEYLAPMDMRSTGFADGSFDACISTNTLEHIPKDSIAAILKELRRILKKDGMVSCLIDYSDHYAHTDSSIGPLEFLKFSAAEYAKFNHNSHFQNRLRHQDYLDLFVNAGFIVKQQVIITSATPPAGVNPGFDSNDPRTFATKGGFVLANS